jgi:MerR family transcriptional regulator, mercuric resistance operon regulatory protein
MARAKPLRIGELSRRTGCKIETIRYYERIGLLRPPERRGRYRQYDAEGVSSLGFIRRARDLGFTLDQVRALLRLSGEGGIACTEARDLAASHLADVRKRIADLKSMAWALATIVRQCDAGAQPSCPLIKTLAGPTFRDMPAL